MNYGETRGLLFFYIIIIITKGGLASDDIVSEPVRARLGQSASLHCKVDGNVSLSVWTRCTDSFNIAVFQHELKEFTINESYSGRVSMTEYHTLTIHQVQDGDFGEYCCKVTTFPQGILEGRVHLLKEDSGLPVMMIVYISCGVIGFVILTGIVSLLVCIKKRRKVRNPLHVTVTRGSLTPKQPSVLQKDSYTTSHTPRHDDDDDDEEEEEEKEEYDDMYLNMETSEL